MEGYIDEEVLRQRGRWMKKYVDGRVDGRRDTWMKGYMNEEFVDR